MQRRAAAAARAALLVLSLVTVQTRALHAQKTDVLVLKNGDHITGEIKKLNRGRLEYSTDDMGRINVEWDKIARLESRSYFEVETQAGLKYFGSLDEPAEDGKIVVSLTVADTLDLMEVVRITPIEATFWQRLGGYVDVGFSFTKATAIAELTGSWEVRYRGRKFYSVLSGSSYFQTQETEGGREGTQRNAFGFQLQRFLGHRWAAGGNTTLEQNDELALDLRVTVGAGGWWAARQTNSILWIVGGGALVGSEQFTGESATATVELVAGSDFSIVEYDAPQLDVTASLDVFASLTTVGRIRLDFETRVRYEVFGDFFFGLTFFDKFDSQPGTLAASKNDLGITTSVGWSF